MTNDQDERAREAIIQEKKMLACLGREWTPTGISVYSLIDDMIAEVGRLRAENLDLRRGRLCRPHSRHSRRGPVERGTHE